MYWVHEMLSENDRTQLQSMMDQGGGVGFVDQTDKIRELKHSGEIRRCIAHIVETKRRLPGLLQEDKPLFEQEVMKEAGFLFFHYMPIYNMVLKTDDLTILDTLIGVLERIETGECDQHEGSYLVGKYLKEIYIDTVLKDTTARDAEGAAEKNKRPRAASPKKLSWTEFKQGYL
jgi:hypothetical protein